MAMNPLREVLGSVSLEMFCELEKATILYYSRKRNTRPSEKTSLRAEPSRRITVDAGIVLRLLPAC